MINKILFITLSNIGDVILTLPSLDFLKDTFPQAKITVAVGPRAKEIFEGNPLIDELIVYDKHCLLKEKVKFFFSLIRKRSDLIIDLRNSGYSFFLPAPYKTSPFLRIPKNILHMKDKHLYRLRNSVHRPSSIVNRRSLWISKEDSEYIESVFNEYNIKPKDKLIIISLGARSHIKRWTIEGFTRLISSLLKENNLKIVLVGDKEDCCVSSDILRILGMSECGLEERAIDLSAKTNLRQLASLLKRASLLVTNDSAVMHLASYLNKPIVALFGPTNPKKYGPWSERYMTIRAGINCSPCEVAQCKFDDTLECMRRIDPECVFEKVLTLLNPNYKPQSLNYKRILIIRTDRIGDVVLTTPMIKVLRDVWPNCYLAIMVSPLCLDIVKNNPYLDEVIVYDKKIAQVGFWANLKFIRMLKKKHFDLALVLHTKKRTNLIAFLAGIKERIGYYNKKFGFLLTKKIPDTRPEGLKHESQYCLDILRELGIECKDESLFMPLEKEEGFWVGALLAKEGIKKEDLLIAMHPGASCPSKRWPKERFAEISQRLIQDYNAKIILLGGKETISIAKDITKCGINLPLINLVGRLSISQLGSLLSRCRLLVSCDSGPVHIAVAVGTPVISIFGRNEKGLSPVRWKPLGKDDIVLHKDVGCKICLAHDCKLDFACLKAITTGEVLEAIDKILKT